jgi:hypothetical protein
MTMPEDVFEDFDSLLNKEVIKLQDKDHFKSQIIRDYLEDLGIRRSEPEAHIVEPFKSFSNLLILVMKYRLAKVLWIL